MDNTQNFYISSVIRVIRGETYTGALTFDALIKQLNEISQTLNTTLGSDKKQNIISIMTYNVKDYEKNLDTYTSNTTDEQKIMLKQYLDICHNILERGKVRGGRKKSRVRSAKRGKSRTRSKQRGKSRGKSNKHRNKK
jgi:hypothetical protein